MAIDDPVEMIPFHVPDVPEVEPYLDDVRGILLSGRLVHGPYRDHLEDAFEAMLGGRAVAVANCSLGLIAALASLHEPGGEVIIPGFTYLATWQAVGWAGMVPVVADVDDRGLLDPAAVSAAITPRTRAILAVHLLGNPADLVGLRAIADRAGVALVFDAAHALGARWVDRPVGAGGDIEVFSLGPTKPIGSADGGIIVVNRPGLVDGIRRFALQGHEIGDLDCVGPGLNMTLGEMHAALALRSLPDIDRRLRRRASLHATYRAAWSGLPLRLADPGSGERSAHKDEIVWLDDRAARVPLRRHLASKGVETRPYYDPAIPDLTAFRGRVESADRSRDLAASGFAIPIHGRLTDANVGAITAAVQEYFG